MNPDPITVKRIRVVPGRLSCVIEIRCPDYRYSNESIAVAALEAYPSLEQHDCVNYDHKPFASVLSETSIPHVLEHIAIDIQAHVSTNPQAVFVGTSEWVDADAGLACVELSFEDDIDALRSLNKAIAFLNNRLRS